LPDLLGRVAVLTLVSAVAVSLLAPLAARSATPVSIASQSLLSAADRPVSLADRSSAAGRERPASLSLAAVAAPIEPETIGANPALAVPPDAQMQATIVPKAHHGKVSPPPPAGTVVSGKATWYCCSRGWRGQAVVALPGALGGKFRGPPATWYVTVCADRCAILPVVDYCGCSWGTAAQKVADLSPEAWAAITDTGLSRGVLKVTVHFGG
jgi:hypothetical protein